MHEEGVGGRREADACVAYHRLSRFKLQIAGGKPNYPLTTRTLTGNLRAEASLGKG